MEEWRNGGMEEWRNGGMTEGRMERWREERTEAQMKFVTIVQDFVPYRGCVPALSEIAREALIILMPFGYFFFYQ